MCALDVKALVFDVFGTVVDWRTSIIRQGKEFGKANGVEADWDAFADAWRGKYGPSMNRVRTGELPWTNLDALHRMALEEVLTEFNITGMSEEVKAEFNLAWHRLDPWPDSVPVLWRLNISKPIHHVQKPLFDLSKLLRDVHAKGRLNRYIEITPLVAAREDMDHCLFRYWIEEVLILQIPQTPRDRGIELRNA